MGTTGGNFDNSGAETEYKLLCIAEILFGKLSLELSPFAQECITPSMFQNKKDM